VSLIDEALRRAQAAQSPGAGGGSGSRVPMPLPDPGRPRRRIRLLAAAAIAAAALIGAGLFLLRRGREPELLRAVATPPASAIAVATAPAPAPTATRLPAGAAGPVVTASIAAASITAVPSRTAPAPASAPLRREPPRTPVILPPVEVSNASSSPRMAVEVQPRRAAPPREPASRTKIYSGTANLPEGKLELEGIVYSEGNPTALINGRVVRPGSYVEGYTVVRIDPDRVELKDENGTIIVTLK
jgi:hypothetical protein